MKKKLSVILALSMSVVLLSGCSLFRAISNANKSTPGPVSPVNNSPVTTTVTPVASEEPSEEPSEEVNPVTNPTTTSGTTSSYLSDEAERTIQSLETDYNKINWGVRYTPGEGLEGLVISVAPFVDDYSTPYLIVAFTNIYDKPLTVNASGYAKGLDGSNIGSISMFTDTLGIGSTYCCKFFLSDIPSGEIHWDSIEPSFSSKEATYWEADYSGTGGNGTVNIDYNIYTKDDAKLGDVQVITVDFAGNVTGFASSYDSGAAAKLFSGSVTINGNAASTQGGDVAIFANPIKQ